MDYYRLRRDDESYRKLFIENIVQFTESAKNFSGNLQSLPEAKMLPVQSSQYNVFTDVLSNQIFMVKEDIFTVMQLFNESLKYRCMFLSDFAFDKLHFYYVPIIPLVDCLSADSVSNLDKSVVSKTVIKNSPDYPDIFRVANVKDKIVIISLEMAEAILRRKPFGIRLEKVVVEK